MADKIGTAYVEIYTETTRFKQGMRDVQSQAETTGRSASNAVNSIGKSSKSAYGDVGNLTRAFERLNRTLFAFAGVVVIRELATQLQNAARAGIDFNKQMEISRLGIASVLASSGTLVTVTGRVAKEAEKFSVAQQLSSKITKQLQVDNLKTAATFQQLTRAFQETLAPALQKGFNVEQVRSFTLAMVQAASAIGLNLDMLAEETRSLLTATINPRTSRIAVALGLTNKDIREIQKDGGDLFDFLMEKLKAFTQAGEYFQTTFSGALSNIQDAFEILLGYASSQFFDFLKQGFIDVQREIVNINEATNEIEINPEAVRKLWEINDAVIESAHALENFVRGLLDVEQRVTTYTNETDNLWYSFGEGIRKAIGDLASLRDIIITELFKPISEFLNDLDIRAGKAAEYGLLGVVLLGTRLGTWFLLLAGIATAVKNVRDLYEETKNLKLTPEEQSILAGETIAKAFGTDKMNMNFEGLDKMREKLESVNKETKKTPSLIKMIFEEFQKLEGTDIIARIAQTWENANERYKKALEDFKSTADLIKEGQAEFLASGKTELSGTEGFIQSPVSKDFLIDIATGKASLEQIMQSLNLTARQSNETWGEFQKLSQASVDMAGTAGYVSTSSEGLSSALGLVAKEAGIADEQLKEIKKTLEGLDKAFAKAMEAIYSNLKSLRREAELAKATVGKTTIERAEIKRWFEYKDRVEDAVTAGKKLGATEKEIRMQLGSTTGEVVKYNNSIKDSEERQEKWKESQKDHTGHIRKQQNAIRDLIKDLSNLEETFSKLNNDTYFKAMKEGMDETTKSFIANQEQANQLEEQWQKNYETYKDRLLKAEIDGLMTHEETKKKLEAIDEKASKFNKTLVSLVESLNKVSAAQAELKIAELTKELVDLTGTTEQRLGAEINVLDVKIKQIQAERDYRDQLEQSISTEIARLSILQEKGELDSKSAKRLEDLRDQYKAIEAAKPFSQQTLDLKESILQQERFKKSLEKSGSLLQGLAYGFKEIGLNMQTSFQLGEQLAKDLYDAIGGVFESVISGERDIEEAFADMGDAVLAAIAKIAVQQIVIPVVFQMFGLEQIFSAIASLNGASATVGTNNGGGSFLEKIFGGSGTNMFSNSGFGWQPFGSNNFMSNIWNTPLFGANAAPTLSAAANTSGSLSLMPGQYGPGIGAGNGAFTFGNALTGIGGLASMGMGVNSLMGGNYLGGAGGIIGGGLMGASALSSMLGLGLSSALGPIGAAVGILSSVLSGFINTKDPGIRLNTGASYGSDLFDIKYTDVDFSESEKSGIKSGVQGWFDAWTKAFGLNWTETLAKVPYDFHASLDSSDLEEVKDMAARWGDDMLRELGGYMSENIFGTFIIGSDSFIQGLTGMSDLRGMEEGELTKLIEGIFQPLYELQKAGTDVGAIFEDLRDLFGDPSAGGVWNNDIAVNAQKQLGQWFTSLQQSGEEINATVARVITTLSEVPNGMERLKELADSGMTLKEAYEKLEKQLSVTKALIVEPIQNMVSTAVQTLDFEEAKNVLISGIKNMMISSVMSSFTADVTRTLIKSTFDSLGGLTDVIEAAIEGDISYSELGDKFTEALNAIGPAIEELQPKFQDLFKMIEKLGNAASGATKVSTAISDSLEDSLKQEDWTGIKSAFLGSLNNMLLDALKGQWIQNMTDIFFQSISDATSSVFPGGLQGLIDNYLSGDIKMADVGGYLESIWSKLGPIIDEMGPKFKEMYDIFVGLLKDAEKIVPEDPTGKGKISNAMSSALESALKGEKWSKVKTAFIGSLNDLLKDVLGQIWVKNMTELFANAISDVTNSVFEGGLQGLMNAYFEGTITSNDFNRYISQFWELLGPIIDEMEPKFRAMFEALGLVSGGLDEAREKLKDMVDGYRDIIEGGNEYLSKIRDLENWYDDQKTAIDELGLSSAETEDALRELIKAYKIEASTIRNDLVTAIYEAQQATKQWIYSLTQTIDELAGTSNSAAVAVDAYVESLARSRDESVPLEGRISAIEDAKNWLDTYVSVTISTIQKTYQARIDALNEEKDLIEKTWASEKKALEDASKIRMKELELQQKQHQDAIDGYNDEIDILQDQKDLQQEIYDSQIEAANEQLKALQEQLTLAQAWQSALESIRDVILSINTGDLNPADQFERLSNQRAEVDRLRELYMSSTGEDKAKYAADLASAIQQELQMASEAYLTPSGEYSDIYQSRMDELQALQSEALSNAVDTKDLQERIADIQENIEALNEERNNILDGIDSQIEDLQDKIDVERDALDSIQDAIDLERDTLEAALEALEEKYQPQLDSIDSNIALLNADMTRDINAFKESVIPYYQALLDEGRELKLKQEQNLKDQLYWLEQIYNAIMGIELVTDSGSVIENSSGTVSGSGEVGSRSYAIGTTYVPFDMVAQIHKGEAIFPAAYNPFTNGGSTREGANITLNANVNVTGNMSDSRAKTIGTEVVRGMWEEIDKYMDSSKGRKKIQQRAQGK